MPVYIFRASNGKEKSVAQLINHKASNLEQYKGTIYSVMVTEGIKGYIFIEGPDIQSIERVTSTIRGVNNKPVKNQPVDLSELQDILVPRPAIEGLQKGDLVEIINGPFKGSRAIITRVDMANQEVTAEITSSAMGLPLKLHAEYVRKIASEGEE